MNSHFISPEKLLIAFSVWCLSVKCHFVNGLYIQTSLAVNYLPATVTDITIHMHKNDGLEN